MSTPMVMKPLKRPLTSIGGLPCSLASSGAGAAARNVRARISSPSKKVDDVTASAKPLVKEDPDPVAHLKSVFAKTEEGKRLLRETSKCSFEKPGDDFTKAYDMAAVIAIRQNNVSKLRDLLQEGKSFNACNQFGESLIHMACRRGNLDVVVFLVKEAGVQLDVRDDFGRTPLHDACWTPVPNLDVMKVLIQQGPPDLLLVEDVRGHTPFHYARKEHWDEWVRFLKSQEPLLLQRLSAIQVVG